MELYVSCAQAHKTHSLLIFTTKKTLAEQMHTNRPADYHLPKRFTPTGRNVGKWPSKHLAHHDQLSLKENKKYSTVLTRLPCALLPSLGCSALYADLQWYFACHFLSCYMVSSVITSNKCSFKQKKGRQHSLPVHIFFFNSMTPDDSTWWNSYSCASFPASGIVNSSQGVKHVFM